KRRRAADVRDPGSDGYVARDGRDGRVWNAQDDESGIVIVHGQPSLLQACGDRLPGAAVANHSYPIEHASLSSFVDKGSGLRGRASEARPPRPDPIVSVQRVVRREVPA